MQSSLRGFSQSFMSDVISAILADDLAAPRDKAEMAAAHFSLGRASGHLSGLRFPVLDPSVLLCCRRDEALD
jgi:hypothetical protein